MTAKQAISILKKHNRWRRGGKGKQQDPQLIGEAIDVCVTLSEYVAKKENIVRYQFKSNYHGKRESANLEQRNELLVKRLKWTHGRLTETYKELEWTERERRRLKEKSDRLRKELYQLKKTVITDREIQEGD